MRYSVHRITFHGDRPLQVGLDVTHSFEDAIKTVNKDYGMDTVEGVWFDDVYIIHCGPNYRGDGQTVNYVIAKQEAE